MARPRCIQGPLPQAWYHVMNRAAAGGDVFPAAADRRDFLALLAGLPASEIEIHAYCLMRSHYHLLVRAGAAGIGRALLRVEGLYARRRRERHGLDGPRLCARCRALPVRAARQRLLVSRYIHLNPVDAGFVSRPEEWPFSSYAAYLDPARAPGWLCTATVLQSFGCVGARRRYRQFVEDGLDPGTRDAGGRSRLGPASGDAAFRGELRRRAALEVGGGPAGFAAIPAHDSALPLAVIARAVAEAFEIDPASLRRPRARRSPHAALARGAFVRAARQFGGHRLRDIAGWLGYGSCTAAAKAAIRCSRAAAADDGVGARLEQAMARLERGDAAGDPEAS